mmetsp:Transcript_18579/g.29589  ORF Transcript_18579/g.29589 Transcript_18579/m.29589 type:complete len:116 (+) Transcript_18579:62-409(+)
MLTDSFARSNISFLCKSFVILLFWLNIRLFPCPSLVFLRFQGISFLTQLRDLASTPVAWNIVVSTSARIAVDAASVLEDPRGTCFIEISSQDNKPTNQSLCTLIKLSLEAHHHAR